MIETFRPASLYDLPVHHRCYFRISSGNDLNHFGKVSSIDLRSKRKEDHQSTRENQGRRKEHTNRLEERGSSSEDGQEGEIFRQVGEPLQDQEDE